MDFYEEASLVMVPSGYKDQKVYSSVPDDGSADLTFSRASNATRVNSEGLVEKVRTNLVTYSEDFSNAAWVKANTTFSGDTLTASAGTAFKAVYQAQTTQGLQVNYFDVAYVDHQWIQILFGTGASDLQYRNFDIQNKVIGGGSGYIYSTIQDFGTYVRIAIVVNTSAKTTVNIAFVDSSSSTRAESTTSTGSFKLLRAQVETGDIATDYIATTSAAVSVGPVSGLPRLNYDAVNPTSASLLLEPQRTNLATYSESFDDSGWFKANNIAVTANAGISPDGYTNADLIYGASSGTISSIQNNLGAASVATYTNSIFVKYSGKQWFYIFELTGNSGANFFDIQNGVLGTQNFGSNAFITSYGNGWYRVGFSQALTSGNVYAIYGVSNADDTLVNTASGTDGALIYGAQLEAGAYATSYIPTLSSAVTRVSDTAINAGDASLFNVNGGVLFGEFSALSDDGTFRQFGIAGTTGNEVNLGLDSTSNRVGGVVRSSGTYYVTSFVVSDTTQTLKAALKYEGASVKLFVNGALVDTHSSATAPANLSEFNYAVGTTNSNKFYGRMNQTLVFPTALSDADCITLTTL